MSFRQPYSSKRKNEGASTSGGQGTNQPADKRQRIQEKQDDWDEDDWDEFSQADMRDIDLMSSQALAETSKPVEQQPFVAPKSMLSLKKSSSSSSSNGTDTAYPSSNESIRKSVSSSASLSSSSSSNGQSSYRLSHSVSLTGSNPRIAPSTEISDALRNELDKWKTDCERITEEKKSIENDLYIKDGEIKNLRSKLRQKDTELNNIRIENTAKVAEQKQLQGDKEKHLKITNEKLETRLQFKEKEHLELEEKYRFLEHKLQLLSTSSPKKPSMSPSKSRSPLVSKPPSIVVSPRPVKGQFPTGDSFRSDERPETSTPKPSTSATEETTILREVGTEISRRCVLNTNFSSGDVNGPKLVARLLDHNCNAAGEITDRGIVGLLHTPSVSSNLQSLHFDRDQSNLLLSPVKSRKMSGAHEQPKDIKPIVDKEHYNLAIHGLQTLLDSVDSIETVESITDITNTAAVLILPLLTDYFTHYIAMLSSNQETNGLTSPTNSGSLKSSSCESSIESLTSSLGLLLKDGATYAQNMEMLTSASLITLRHLVIYSAAVREALYPKFDIVKEDRKTKSRGQKPLSEVESSGMETDVMTGSLFTSVTLSSTVQQQLQSSNLLNNIVKLATPSIENPIYNTSIVNLALDVLISFVRKTTTSQLDNLVPLTSVLSNCLQCDNHPVIVISAIDLLSCLSQSDKIRSSLTKQTVSCPLTSVYMLANKPFENANEEERRQIHIKIIMCMLNFTSCRNGVNQLVETTCSCAQEFVRSMVLIIHKVMEDYLVHKNNSLISVLKQGLKLLNTIWFYDGDLLEKSYHYVNLIYSLYTIFKINPEQYENELCMLRQLEGNEEEEEEESMEADD